MADLVTAGRALFSSEAIHPATRLFNAELQQMLAAAPALSNANLAQFRKMQMEGQGAFGAAVFLDRATEMRIPGLGGEITLRAIVPAAVKGVYMHIHGGGWTIGSARLQDERLAEIADGCEMAAVSVEYRLAPEHPYPAAVDDCEAAALWLAGRAESEFGSDRLVIGGESAGAHLAATTLQRMRDRHGYTGFRGAALTYGMYDMTQTPSVRRWGDRRLILSTPLIEWFADQFLPAGIDRGDPDVSPLYGDLSRMPPALFSVGTLDPLIDDSLFMHARWLAAGNEAELAVYPGGTHAFDMFPIEIAQEAKSRIDDFIRRLVTGGQ